MRIELKATGLIRIAMLLGLCFACATGCKKQRPMATIAPPPVQTVPRVQHDEKLPEPPPPQTSPPGPAPQSTITDQPVAALPPPPEPPQKAKKRVARKTVRPATAPAAPPPAAAPVQQAKMEEPAGPAAAPAPEATEAAPKLGQLLSAEQEQSYNQAIDQELQRARSNLTFAEGKTLSDPQKSVVTQVQGFIKQAEDARKADLVEAKGLSHKADILASDLARSLQ